MHAMGHRLHIALFDRAGSNGAQLPPEQHIPPEPLPAVMTAVRDCTATGRSRSSPHHAGHLDPPDLAAAPALVNR